MSMFNIGLSGLSSTQRALEVTSNNIANASTAGYKTASSEFSAIYNGGQRSGVNVAAVNENFEKTGNLVKTGQNLDLAITGKGFFCGGGKWPVGFSQAGQFGLDADRHIINNNGNKLQGFGIDEQGNLIPGVLTDLKIEAANIPAKATENIQFSLNLNSASGLIALKTYTTPLTPPASTPKADAFDPKNGGAFNYSQSSEVFDSLGNSHTLTQYFNHSGANQWDVVYYMDGKPLAADALNWQGKTSTPMLTSALDSTGQVVDNVGVLRMTFGTDGQLRPLDNPATLPADDNNTTDAAGRREVSISFNPDAASPMAIKLDLVKSTQFGSAFGLYENKADGFTSGEFSGVSVAEDGQVLATFSNGATKLQGQIALASFANPQGLESANNTMWYASEQSGLPLSAPRAKAVLAAAGGLLHGVEC